MATSAIKQSFRAACRDAIGDADRRSNLQELSVQSGYLSLTRRKAPTAVPRKCLYQSTYIDRRRELSLKAFDNRIKTSLRVFDDRTKRVFENRTGTIFDNQIDLRKASKRAARIRCSLSTESAAYHVLPGGKRLEVLERKAKKRKGAPVVFIPGSYHAAWCYEAHWLDYFADAGHDSYAISLMGQGNSDLADGSVGGTIFSHADNIADVIRERVAEPPVLVGHSFGGLAVQAYLSNLGTSDGSPGLPPLAGAVLLCSAPPTGNSEMVKRISLRTPIRAIKLTWSLATKGFVNNLGLCRDTFFSPDMPDTDVARYQKLLASSSKQPLVDLRALNQSLPVSKPPDDGPPVFVLGAANDILVDKEGFEETAAYFGAEAVTLPDMAHDVMLDVKWRDAADALLTWLSKQGF